MAAESPNSILHRQFRAARRVSAPLLAIATPDPAATIEWIIALDGAENPPADDPPSAPADDAVCDVRVQWDVIRGMRALNESGKQWIDRTFPEGNDPTVGNPIEFALACLKLPGNAIAFVHLANRWLSDAPFIQGVWNIRDAFKQNHRTLVLLGPAIHLPAELSGDVIVFDEPLPGASHIRQIIGECFASAGMGMPQAKDGEDDPLAPAIEAVQGLPAFQAEQVIAMSLTRSGLDVPNLWESKRRQIELTPGLKVYRDPVRFGDIGGVACVKFFLSRVLYGQAAPSAIVFVDEIEKFMAGSVGASGSGGGDSSGVSQDQLGAILAYMQDQAASGCILIGPPGSGKSVIAKAVGNEAGIPTIQLDLGAMKGSLVGQSEQHIRAALKVITSISNGRSLWIATCNSIGDLPPELRRRFTLGTFFFDLPDVEERKQIWTIWIRHYGLDSETEAFPQDEGWTGAEIRQCCDIAWRLGISLVDASRFIVPVSRSAGEQIEKLRRSAEGRFLSASQKGIYRREAVSPSSRPSRPRRAMALAAEE